jgi:hypothetical protein
MTWKPTYTSKGAVLSADGRHRFVLHRSWVGETLRNDVLYRDPMADYRALIFLMLNPSKADAERPDPTLNSCVRIAGSHGCGHALLGNLWSIRSTDWKTLRDDTLDRNVAESDAMLMQLLLDPCEMLSINYLSDVKLVLAWGSRVMDIPGAAPRIRAVCNLISRAEKQLGHDLHVYCLGQTQSGNPNHPLFMAATTPLELWDGMCEAKP